MIVIGVGHKLMKEKPLTCMGVTVENATKSCAAVEPALQCVVEKKKRKMRHNATMRGCAAA